MKAKQIELDAKLFSQFKYALNPHNDIVPISDSVTLRLETLRVKIAKNHEQIAIIQDQFNRLKS